MQKTRRDWKAIKKRRAEQVAALAKQEQGLESSEIFKLSVEAKLQELHHAEKWWQNFERCGRDKVYICCTDCQRITERFYSCNNRWCPRCNWRVSDTRRKLLEKMTEGMTNVKHVVLTQRNFEVLNHAAIVNSRRNLLKLRRRLLTSKVVGGCASLEFTRETTGWHMHWHLLLHVRYLCAGCLAFEWGQLVNQDFAVVKVLPVTDKSYVQEVCKYAVKGSELAKWDGQHIEQFITAQRGTRMFTVFGHFKKLRQFARAAVEMEKVEREPCVCGCTKVFAAKSEDEANRIFNNQFKTGR